MSPLDSALRYAGRGWPIFPCHAWPDKSPYVPTGFHAASLDPDQLAEWWCRWPAALPGLPTGAPCGHVVLDVDTKRGVDGWQTLAQLENCPIRLPAPTVITPSGAGHLYYQRPQGGLRNTAGRRGRGIGAGLDWRGDGGYVILPSPGSGYRWDADHNFRTCAPPPVPPELLPKEPKRSASIRPVTPERGISPYADAALDQACRAIIGAPAGEQESTLNGECFSIGTLAGAGGIPAEFARKALCWAARQVRDYDPRDPWRAQEIEHKVDRAFDDGLAQPRGARHG